MRMTILSVIAVCLLAASNNAQAGAWMNGNKLHEICTSAKSEDQVYCTGYIEGAMDAIRDDASLLSQCAFAIPPSMSSETAKAVIVKWLEDHPKTWSVHADGIVAVAMTNEFPCK